MSYTLKCGHGVPFDSIYFVDSKTRSSVSSGREIAVEDPPFGGRGGFLGILARGCFQDRDDNRRLLEASVLPVAFHPVFDHGSDCALFILDELDSGSFHGEESL
jgi:hypothetical protein